MGGGRLEQVLTERNDNGKCRGRAMPGYLAELYTAALWWWSARRTGSPRTDFADGPVVKGRSTTLFCAWRAWSRFRVAIPNWDKTLPTITACPDATFRRIDGIATYMLTDHEKTVATDRVGGIAVRAWEVVEVARAARRFVHVCRRIRKPRAARSRR